MCTKTIWVFWWISKRIHFNFNSWFPQYAFIQVNYFIRLRWSTTVKSFRKKKKRALLFRIVSFTFHFFVSSEIVQKSGPGSKFDIFLRTHSGDCLTRSIWILTTRRNRFNYREILQTSITLCIKWFQFRIEARVMPR